MKTVSEVLFEELCAVTGCEFYRVPEATEEGHRRPDYRVVLRSGRELIVEVKQFDPNPQEEEVLNGTTRAFGTTPGDRIRKAVRSGGKQLKAMAKGEKPALLVVFDNVGTRMHTDQYAVLTAMRGLDVVPVSIPNNPAEAPVFHKRRPGPRKMLTANANTSISGIGVLRRIQRGPVMEVYHNPHAAVPLKWKELAGESVVHFQMSSDQNNWLRMGPK